MHILLLSLALWAAPTEAADCVVVCPQAMLPQLEPWLAHRREQGHRFAWLPNTLSAEQLQAEIRYIGRSGNLRSVLLVGDADPAAAYDPQVRSFATPTHFSEAEVNVNWGSEPEIATDHPYADLDGDSLPDLAVGRLPVDTPRQLGLLVQKILAYENAAPPGDWRRRVNFVAGVGGFGAMVDALLQTATKKFLTEGIPGAYRTTMTYGSWRSPYCPDPRTFHDVTLQRLNEGCLFWVYLGHGQRTSLDRVRTPAGLFPIFAAADAVKLDARVGAPIAVLLACYTGAFDGAEDCVAEEMLHAAGGPVAVLGGSRVTMPYAMAVMGDAMLDEVFQHRRGTLGEVLLHAKRRMLRGDQNNSNRQMLDLLALAVSPARGQLAQERLEHAQMFNLLGDPLLRLRHGEQVDVTMPETAAPGEEVTISLESPLAGRCTLELVCRRDRLKGNLPPRQKFEPTHEALAGFNATYQQANDRVWLTKTTILHAGEWRTTLTIPEAAEGPCWVRVHVEGERSFALGAAAVQVSSDSP